MAEQTSEQAAAIQADAAASARAAAETALKQGEPTVEQVQAYLDTHPDAAKQLQLTAKVDGEEQSVALAALQTSYQLESAARQRLGAAALKEKELATREAALAEKGDPTNIMEAVLQRFAKPQPAPDPLVGLDSPGMLIDDGPRLVNVTRGLLTENQRLAAENKAIAERQTLSDKRLEAMEKAQTNVFQWTRMKEDFDGVHRQNPDFTARVTVKPDGTFDLDLGSNPVVTAEVLRLKQSGEIPDPRFNNQVPKTLSYAELTKGIEAAEAAKYEARKVAAERKHQETLRTSVSGVSSATSAIEIPSDLIDLPGDSKAEIWRKAEARGNLIREQARAEGLLKNEE